MVEDDVVPLCLSLEAATLCIERQEDKRTGLSEKGQGLLWESTLAAGRFASGVGTAGGRPPTDGGPPVG